MSQGITGAPPYTTASYAGNPFAPEPRGLFHRAAAGETPQVLYVITSVTPPPPDRVGGTPASTTQPDHTAAKEPGTLEKLMAKVNTPGKRMLFALTAAVLCAAAMAGAIAITGLTLGLAPATLIAGAGLAGLIGGTIAPIGARSGKPPHEARDQPSAPPAQSHPVPGNLYVRERVPTPVAVSQPVQPAPSTYVGGGRSGGGSDFLMWALLAAAIN